MTRVVAFLRGINLPRRNRISMPDLRRLLTTAGFLDVRTYLNSGNVLLATSAPPREVAEALERVIDAELGLDVRVVVRTQSELQAVARANPLAGVAINPKRYQVAFFSESVPSDLEPRLSAATADSERFVILGREVYAWLPESVERSRLWALLAGPRLGGVATLRNWTSVETLVTLL